MQLDRVTTPRVAVPILVVIGYVLYVILDSPDGNAIRWPSIVAWILAGICVLVYHIMNRNAPKKLLVASAVLLTIAIGILAYIIYFVEGFGGVALFIIGVLPFVGLALLLFAISIYIPVKQSRPLQ